jgi:hypothetical protein
MKNSLKFFNEQLFTTPKWLINPNLFSEGVGSDIVLLQRLQEKVIYELTSPLMWNWLVFGETNLPKGQAYTYDELLKDMEKEIWKELPNHREIDIKRRNLQKMYVVKLITALRLAMPGDLGSTDCVTVLMDHITQLRIQIDRTIPNYTDHASTMHLEDMRNRLQMAMDYQKKNYPTDYRAFGWPGPGAGLRDAFNSTSVLSGDQELTGHHSCWQ